MEQQDSNSNSVCRNICGVCIDAVENGESRGGTHFSPVWKVKAGHDLRGASSSYSSSFVDSILQIQCQGDISPLNHPMYLCLSTRQPTVTHKDTVKTGMVTQS